MLNKVFYEGVVKKEYKVISKIYHVIYENSRRFKGHMHDFLDDVGILNYFKVVHRRTNTIVPVEVNWYPPDPGESLMCCDGASVDNPGDARVGVIA